MINDHFVVGGTAGCIVASRLSDADPNLSILVVEGGANNYNNPAITNPILFLSHLLPTSNTTLFYQGTAEEQLGGRQLVVPSGGVLGGGSSINLMMYTRAQRSDWDAWETEGWSANDMIPYLKKVYIILTGGNSSSILLMDVFSSRLTMAPVKMTPTALMARL